MVWQQRQRRSASCSAARYEEKWLLVRHEDAVHHVDDAIGLVLMRNGDDGRSALLIRQRYVRSRHRRGEFAAFDGGQDCCSIALLDHLLKLSGGNLSRKNVIGDDLDERGFIFWFHKRIDGTGG